MNHRSLAILLVAALAGCAAPSPDTPELGNRIRFRIAARGEVDSITSAGHRVFVVLLGPDGRRQETRIFSPKYAESESLTGSLGLRAAALFDLPRPEWAESLHGDPRLAHDVILPPGCTLCFEPGAFYVYRQIAGTKRFAADLNGEIVLGQITKDASRYVELRAAAGPELGFDDDPPGWPPNGSLE